MTKNRSHRVNLGTHAVPGRKGGGRVALFAFSWADYAQLLGLKVGTVQKLARAGAFDPQDLASVISYWTVKRNPSLLGGSWQPDRPTPAQVRAWGWWWWRSGDSAEAMFLWVQRGKVQGGSRSFGLVGEWAPCVAY